MTEINPISKLSDMGRTKSYRVPPSSSKISKTTPAIGSIPITGGTNNQPPAPTRPITPSASDAERELEREMERTRERMRRLKEKRKADKEARRKAEEEAVRRAAEEERQR
ncbi:hypothetical protein EV368DRAFT_88575 [Lentinula lateritia]|nr:hypothetical protein EV368DRAFT_88575 [Lentinula lateritia]